MGYYDLATSHFEDYVIHSVLEAKIAEIGIKRGQFYKMVYDKLY